MEPCFEFGGPGLGCGLAGAGLVRQSSRIGGRLGAAGAAGGIWRLLSACGRGLWGSGALLGSAGLWALGSGLWAGLGAGLGSSGFEMEIGLLFLERLCPVLWGWAGRDLVGLKRKLVC